MKKVVFELFLNPGAYIFFKKGTRWGLLSISNRHTKKNKC